MPLWKKKKAAEPAAPLDVLRWKIVAVNILFAAMVVATLCFVAARQGKNALEEKHRLAFASLCSALEQPILETQTIDHKAIYSSALENRLVPALFEKGAPIENPYLQGDDAAPLLTLSEPMLEEARQSVDGQNGLWAKTVVRQAYTLRDGSALWFAEYCAIPTASGNWIEMYLFQDAATFRQEWGRMQLLYVAVAAGGVLALGALAFALTGWAMQPARRAERMEREFLAAASHELKSPLAVIITSAELLPSGGEEAKYRANILSEAHRMAQLVQELLSLSRLETAARQIMPAKLDTEAFLSGKFTRHGSRWRQRPVTG